MKRKVEQSLAVIILLSMIVSLAFYIGLQVKISHNAIISESKFLLSQIARVLTENERDAEKINREFREEALDKAKAAAYIVQHKPEIVKSRKQAKKIAELISVDELHFIDTKGTIIGGTTPKYYGYNFNSGEQMQFFLPLLKDKSLQLCQPITPNTADGKPMQYAAVWREDGRGIVQIGLEPERVLEATRKNELSYIFSLLTVADDSTIYAVSADTYEILGSTAPDYVGKTLTELGMDVYPERLNNEKMYFRTKVDGVSQFAVFIRANEDVLLCRTVASEGIILRIGEDAVQLIFYLIVLAMIMFFFISTYLDKNIIQAIHAINGKLQNISDGKLGERVNVNTTPEFAELSDHINLMVSSILESTDKLSLVLDMADICIGRFEYRQKYKKMMITAEVWDILGVSKAECMDMQKDYQSFEEGIKRLIAGTVDGEPDVYSLRGDAEKYFKIKVFAHEDVVFGMLMDVTQDIQTRKKIEKDRDIDLLTGLLVRRAFRVHAAARIAKPEILKYAAILIIDADNLKGVNDCYGHLTGDKYLCEIANVISSCSAPEKITGRISGDEFVQLIYGCDSSEELDMYLKEALEQQSAHTVKINDKITLPLSYSVGYARFGSDGTEYRELVRLADERMYITKRSKKQTT